MNEKRSTMCVFFERTFFVGRCASVQIRCGWVDHLRGCLPSCAMVSHTFTDEEVCLLAGGQSGCRQDSVSIQTIRTPFLTVPDLFSALLRKSVLVHVVPMHAIRTRKCIDPECETQTSKQQNTSLQQSPRQSTNKQLLDSTENRRNMHLITHPSPFSGVARHAGYGHGRGRRLGRHRTFCLKNHMFSERSQLHSSL